MRSHRLYFAMALIVLADSALASRGSSSGSASGAVGLLMLFVGGGIGKLLWGTGGALIGGAVGVVLAILFANWIAGIFVAGITYWFLSSLYSGWRQDREEKRKEEEAKRGKVVAQDSAA